jgi:hypothetical protein
LCASEISWTTTATKNQNIKRPKMKRKDPPCRSSKGLDPRDFAWHKFHRDQFPNIGDRVWLKSEQSYGRIVVDTSADASPEGPGPQADATTEDHDDDDGPCRDEVNNNDPGDKNQKASSIDESCRGSSLRMVRLENDDSKDQAITVPLRRPYDAVRMYAPPAIIICHDTDDFRRLAQTQDLGNHNNGGIGVLEIGCSTGQTSRIVWPRLLRHDDCDHNRWMGWDTGQTMVDKVQDKIDQYIIDNNNTRTSGHMNKKEALVCRKIDAMVDPETAWQMAIDHFCPPTTNSSSSNMTILIDIGGNRNANAVAKILQWALELPGHGTNNNKTIVLRIVIIKSEEMFALDDPMNWFLDTRHKQRLDVRLSSTMISTAAAGSSSSIGIKIFPSHPLKAPKRYSPHDPTRFVCRYHNYHPKGCQKAEACQFDHTHCHWCLQAGHMALDCPTRYE